MKAFSEPILHRLLLSMHRLLHDIPFAPLTHPSLLQHGHITISNNQRNQHVIHYTPGSFQRLSCFAFVAYLNTKDILFKTAQEPGKIISRINARKEFGVTNRENPFQASDIRVIVDTSTGEGRARPLLIVIAQAFFRTVCTVSSFLMTPTRLRRYASATTFECVDHPATTCVAGCALQYYFASIPCLAFTTVFAYTTQICVDTPLVVALKLPSGIRLRYHPFWRR